MMQQNWKLTASGLTWAEQSTTMTGTELRGISNHEGEHSVVEKCNVEDTKEPERECVVQGRLTRDELVHVARFWQNIMDRGKGNGLAQAEKKGIIVKEPLKAKDQVVVDDDVERQKAYIWTAEGAQKAEDSSYRSHCKDTGEQHKCLESLFEKARKITQGAAVSQADFDAFLVHTARADIENNQPRGIIDARDFQHWIEYLQQPSENSDYDETYSDQNPDKKNSKMQEKIFKWTDYGATWANGFLPGPEPPSTQELNDCRKATKIPSLTALDCSLFTYMSQKTKQGPDEKVMPTFLSEDLVPQLLLTKEDWWFRKSVKSIAFSHMVLRFIEFADDGAREQKEREEKEQNNAWLNQKRGQVLLWKLPRANVWMDYILKKNEGSEYHLLSKYGYPDFVDAPSGKKIPKDLDWGLLQTKIPEEPRGAYILHTHPKRENTAASCGGDSASITFDLEKTCEENFIQNYYWGDCEDSRVWKDRQGNDCSWYYRLQDPAKPPAKPALCDTLTGLAANEASILSLASTARSASSGGKIGNAMQMCCRCMGPKAQVLDRELYETKTVSEEDLKWLAKYTPDKTIESALDPLDVLETPAVYHLKELEKRKAKKEELYPPEQVVRGGS